MGDGRAELAISICGGSWWMTLFLVTNDASDTYLSLFAHTTR